jgi:hypothetical protein
MPLLPIALRGCVCTYPFSGISEHSQRAPEEGPMPETTHPGGHAGDTEGGRPRRNVLVISSVERPFAALREALGDVDELRVVVPTVRQSRLQWLANDDDAVREEADAAASKIAEAIPAEDAGAIAGDPDPLQAAEDALADFDADELVVVTRPDEEASWLEEGRAEDTERSFPNLEVTRLVVDAV